MAFCYVHIREKEDRTGQQNKNNYKAQEKKKKSYQSKERGEGKSSKKLKRIALWCRKAPENLSSESLQQKKIEEK